MWSWVSKKLGLSEQTRASLVEDVARDALGGATAGEETVDEETVQIVASTAGILLCVAFADGEFCEAEEAKLRDILGQIQGMDASGVERLVDRLRGAALEITAPQATSYARRLLALTAIDFRKLLLGMLLDLAIADGSLTLSENNMLRNIARALGFSQQDYNLAQARYREHLAVLQG